MNFLSTKVAYIIFFYTGEYDDRREIPLAVFTREWEADKVLAQFNEELSVQKLDKPRSHDEVWATRNREWRGHFVDDNGATVRIRTLPLYEAN
tara:strand:- start:3189 stop:3467 length:279 start_codon:yes stop_codon:yes gene_type:complete